MKIEYAIPSFGRSDSVTTMDYLKKCKIYVSPQEYNDYVKNNPQWSDRIVKVPDGVQGYGKARINNWILDNVFTDDLDGLVILDDDISFLMKHKLDVSENRNGTPIDDEMEVYEIIENSMSLAKQWGVNMWSFNLTNNPLSFDYFKPFRTLAYLDGGLQGFCIRDELRYDEKLTVKEDVDMFLQQIQKYHGILRIERYFWNKRSFEGVGGSQAFRSSETEKEQFKILQERWGSDVIKLNRPTAKVKKGIRSLGGAIKVNIPINGI